MIIEQFEDKGLSHYSYAVLSESESQIVLIDPSRDIESYQRFAANHGARIIGVIETHPHADFVSGHLEVYETTGAVIYCSRLLGASYPHKTFDDGEMIEYGEIRLKAVNTPGHSPDSISIVMEHDGKDKAIFTGDTLFIGDCGRPDLRENAGNLTAKREELAVEMYHSLRKLSLLDNEVLVYPAHGAGTLCGKALSDANRSTIGAEKWSNWSLQEMDVDTFVKALLEDQPFIPKYFSYDVQLNKEGAIGMKASIAGIPINKVPEKLNPEIYIIDSRAEIDFKKGHLPGSINIQNGAKFETWLGSIIAPKQAFYLVAENETALQEIIRRSASIGYESFIKTAFVFKTGEEKTNSIDLNHFKTNPDAYTIVDIRNPMEVKEHPIFKNSINIPLYELTERVSEIPLNKPIVVHCAGGYRSAAGSSIVNNTYKNKTQVFDLGEAIKEFN